jgi:NADH-quinone oxidoreductase subunit A
MEKLIGLIIMLAVATGLVLVFYGLNRLLGPKSSNVVKDTPFETGRAPIAASGRRMAVKFYMIAILFVLFDIEMIFFYPWAVVFRDIGIAALISMLIFIAVLVLGLAYIWKRGALEWQ